MSARSQLFTARTALAFAFCILLSGCGSSDQTHQTDEHPATNPIQVTPVALVTVQNEVAVPAKVQADPARVVHLYPPVSGRLVSLRVRPGDLVRAGQVVATIESSDAASARSDYEKAKIEANRSQQAEQRAALLFQHEVLSQKDYEDIKAQAESARSDLARTEQRLRMLGLSLTTDSDLVSLKAPQSGVVLEIGAANGELSKSLDNANAIVTIADLDSVWIVGDLYEKDASLAARGVPVNVTLAALPGRNWQGTIANVSDVLDPTSRTVKIRVVLPNPRHELKPEMFATIRLQGRKQALVSVPTTAILHDGNQAYVMVKMPNGNYQKRIVNVAEAKAETTEVASGLKPGELVVTAGAELLRQQGAGS
jgi:cobalt-zinc-cadmium efflux system membrane fusion protein